MKTLGLIAGTAMVMATALSPALARDYCDTHRCYHRGPVGAAADTAAGIAGAAIGTAGAIATAPFRDSYAYDPSGNVVPRSGWATAPLPVVALARAIVMTRDPTKG